MYKCKMKLMKKEKYGFNWVKEYSKMKEFNKIFPQFDVIVTCGDVVKCRTETELRIGSHNVVYISLYIALIRMHGVRSCWHIHCHYPKSGTFKQTAAMIQWERERERERESECLHAYVCVYGRVWGTSKERERDRVYVRQYTRILVHFRSTI